MKVADEVDLEHGFPRRVGWWADRLLHLSFTQKKSPPRRSASLWLRPDIVVDIERDGQRELLAAEPA